MLQLYLEAFFSGSGTDANVFIAIRDSANWNKTVVKLSDERMKPLKMVKRINSSSFHDDQYNIHITYVT